MTMKLHTVSQAVQKILDRIFVRGRIDFLPSTAKIEFCRMIFGVWKGDVTIEQQKEIDKVLTMAMGLVYHSSQTYIFDHRPKPHHILSLEYACNGLGLEIILTFYADVDGIVRHKTFISDYHLSRPCEVDLTLI